MQSTSQQILSLCKELYATNSKISEHWLYTENIIQIEANLLAGKWSMSKVHVERLASINIQQAFLQFD